jgi:GTPase SAR1 family protein
MVPKSDEVVIQTSMQQEEEEESFWGAAAFSKALRSRLWSRNMAEGKETLPKGVDWGQLPSSWNVLVLGPAGAGKSSLLFTWWRALHDSPAVEETHAVLAQLNLGWNLSDAKRPVESQGGRGLRSRHGTTGLRILDMFPPRGGGGGAGLCIHDTKGQQFFDSKERNHTGSLLKGVALEGSNQEKENLRYWFSVGSMGFFEQRSLSTSPHAVVLVFNILLRSLQKMVSSADSSKEMSPQLELYCGVIQQARREGLEVFICLTHLDVFEEREAASAASPQTSEETRVGEAVQPLLNDLAQKLSRALSRGGADVPSNRIYVVENYRATKNDADARVELAALELLETLIDSADAHLMRKCQEKKEGCSVS